MAKIERVAGLHQTVSRRGLMDEFGNVGLRKIENITFHYISILADEIIL